MQEISSSFFVGIIETSDVLIAGVRRILRRVRFLVGSGLTAKAMKLVMPVFPSSIIPRLRKRKQPNRFAKFLLPGLLGRLCKTFTQSPAASLLSRHEVAIMYFGRTSEFLMMTSERMVIPSGRYTLGQLLCGLYKRGDRWAYELDDSHLVCTVNGRDARLCDTIRPGEEICLFSRKSIFEA